MMDEQYVADLIARADVVSSSPFPNCLVVACQLPNGFVFVEYAALSEIDKSAEDVAEELFDTCMENIFARVYETELYRHMSMAGEQINKTEIDVKLQRERRSNPTYWDDNTEE